jgi:mitochondrial fission protein ELM1
MRPPLVVWQFTDGKPGHESQARGLISALKRRTEVHAYRLPVSDCRCGIASLIRRRHPCQSNYPPPDLILACGRTTHFAALAARRACGGRLVSLMKPPLPMRLYDLCLIPEHDGVRPGGNVLLTRGALNPVVSVPASDERAGRGLFLIGGPSAHHGWPRTSLVEHVCQIVDRDPKRRWTLTTSRRTPSEFVGQLRSEVAVHALDSRIQVIPVEETPQGWVASQLSRTDVAVVTEDSVSMVYESLTAGVSVSLIRMPRRGRSRVAAGVERLLHDRFVSPIDDYLTGGSFPASEHVLAEADRCAETLMSQWFARRMRAA